MEKTKYRTITMSLTEEEYDEVYVAWREWNVSEEAKDKSLRETGLGRFCKDVLLSEIAFSRASVSHK